MVGTGDWTLGAAPHAARANGAVATGPDGRICIIGGFSALNSNGNSVALNDVETYDPSSNTWTTRAPLPTCDIVCSVSNV